MNENAVSPSAEIIEDSEEGQAENSDTLRPAWPKITKIQGDASKC